MYDLDLNDYETQDDDLELVKQRIMKKRLIDGMRESEGSMADPVLSSLAGGFDVLSRHSAAQLDPVATITGLPIKGYQTPNISNEYQKALAVRQSKTKSKALDETQMLKNLEDIKTNRLKARSEAEYKRQKAMTDLYRAQQWAEIQGKNAGTAADKSFWDMEAKKIQNAINQQRADTERQYTIQGKIPLAQSQAALADERAESEEEFRDPKIGKIGAESDFIGSRMETEDVLRDPRADLLRAQAEAARAKAQKAKSDGAKKTSANNRMRPGDILKVQEGDSVARLLPDIESTIKANIDLFDPISGRIAEINPYDERAQAVNAQIKSSAQAFGRYMEGGVLRAEDERKYRDMFPKLGDKPEVAKSKLAVVQRQLIAKQQADLNALGKSGYDVSPFVRRETPEVPKMISQGSGKPQITKEQALQELRNRGRIK